MKNSIIVLSLLVLLVTGTTGCGKSQTMSQPTTPEETIKAMVQAANSSNQSQANKYFPGITENIIKKVTDDGKVQDVQVSKAQDNSQVVGELYRVKIFYSDGSNEEFAMQVQQRDKSWIINEIE